MFVFVDVCVHMCCGMHNSSHTCMWVVPPSQGSNTGVSIPAAVSSVQMSRRTASYLDWYKISSEKRMGDKELDWEVMGTRLKMNPSFGCVMVLGGGGADIPEDIKVR